MKQIDISQTELKQWVAAKLADLHSEPLLNFDALAGDASFRRYFRAHTASGGHIAALAPPAKENNSGFVAVATLLHNAAVPAPVVLSYDLQRGFLLLSDLGDQVLLPHLNSENVDAYYAGALAELLKMQQIKAVVDLPLYSGDALMTELGRFQEWFIQGLLKLTLTRHDQQLVNRAQQIIVASAAAQPQVFVHRDYQSRNLMLQADGKLAVIDFQDAALGPLTYDLASLLRDTHITWPAQQVRDWALNYAQLARQCGLLPDYDENTFLRWFDLNSLERNITVLGTFSRLYLRDGKPGYLQHIPRLLHYIFTVGANYQEFKPFLHWFEERLMPVIAQQSWYEPHP